MIKTLLRSALVAISLGAAAVVARGAESNCYVAPYDPNLHGTFEICSNGAGPSICRLCQQGICPVVSCSGKPAVSEQPPTAPPLAAKPPPPMTTPPPGQAHRR